MLGKREGFYEGGPAGRKANQLAYFRVITSHAETRTYDIQITGFSKEVSDSVYYGVQALAAFTSTFGDEASAQVEAGTYGICGFVGNNPFILGFFTPVIADEIEDEGLAKNISTGAGNEGFTPGSASGQKEGLDPGDYCIQTKGRCKIIWRRSGILEVEATKMCRRTYYPSNNRLADICRNYEFTSDGLMIRSLNVNDDDDTYYLARYKNNLKADYVVQVERGSVTPDDEDLIEKHSIGKTPGRTGNIQDPAYVHFVKVDGTYQKAVLPGGADPTPGKAAWYRGVDPDGTFEETHAGETVTKKISPNGDLELNYNDNTTIEVTSSGDVTIEHKGDLNYTNEGLTVEATSAGEVTITILKGLTLECDELTAKVTKAAKLSSKDWSQDYEGEYDITGSAGEFLSMAQGKVALGNSTVELVDIVYQIIDLLTQALTPGYNTPLTNVAQFAALLPKLMTLKKG